MSPPSKRGLLVGLSEFSINIGITFGFLSSYVFSLVDADTCISECTNITNGTLPIVVDNYKGWRLMLGTGCILPIIEFVLATFFMAETPRWLVLRGKIDEAKCVLRNILAKDDKNDGKNKKAGNETQNVLDKAILQHSDSDSDNEVSNNANPHVEEVILSDFESRSLSEEKGPQGLSEAEVNRQVSEIDASLQKERVISQAGCFGWKPIFCPSKPARSMLIIGIFVAISQQLSGVEAFMYYSPSILESAGIDDRVQKLGITFLMGLIKMLTIVVAALLLDSPKFCGRRPLIIISSIGVTVSMLMMAVGFQIEMPSLNVSSLFLFCIFFSLGLGPICWLLSSEIYSLDIRSRAMSLSTGLNRLTACIVASTFLSLSNAISSAGTFYMFTILNCVTAVCYFLIIPETKGKSLESMVDFFTNQQHLCIPCQQRTNRNAHKLMNASERVSDQDYI